MFRTNGMKRRLRAVIASLTAATLVLTGCSTETNYVNGIRDPLVFATYGTATGTYADLAAATDRASVATGVRMRIITSDTSVGRLAAVRSGAASIGRLGDEYFFGFEGAFEFASEDWGPQQTRVVWAPAGPQGMMTRKADGYETLADLKGKRFPRYPANPSANAKVLSALAYAKLSADDVEWVNIGYSEQADALKSKRIDVLYQATSGASLFELESTVPVSWLDFDPNDAEAVARMQAVAPSVHLEEFTGAAGLEEGESGMGIYYAVPVATYADMPEDEVYEIITSFAQAFPEFEDTTSTSHTWDPKLIQDTPKEAPFHPGLIRWLKENDRWSPEAQEKQDELLEREEKLAAEWEKFMETDPAADELFDGWLDWKKQAGLSKPSEEFVAGRESLATLWEG